MSKALDRFGCPKCFSVFRSGFPRCPLDGSVLQFLSEDPLIGFVLAERYVIEALIGEGGMGRVYRARHIRMSRRFAIKVLFGDLAADGKARSRFSREAESSSRLSHPNVVSVVDFGETDEGLLYLVMDFIDGEELHRVIAREAPFATARALDLLRQLARGLGHAHDRGLVHRDFKTENVLITTDGGDEIARIVDFGIAVLGEMTAPEHRLTTEGMVLGTPAYMSPEQSTGEEIDHRADLFSLGVMLYEMLAGKLPFDGTPIAMAKANLAAPVPPIATRAPGVRADRRLEAVAMRLMAKEPEQRFASATALLAHLDQVFGRPADTEPPPIARGEAAAVAALPERTMSEEFFLRADDVEALPGEPTGESGVIARAERRRWVIAGAVAAAALLVAGGALFAHYRSRPERGELAAVSH
ncbi:MAG TPA: serine/threonine-protein kinase, partial [Kofleriaceae bacterium]|nr:serine/threonine-protein kinase [Kofleriaceae bacterium]